MIGWCTGPVVLDLAGGAMAGWWVVALLLISSPACGDSGGTDLDDGPATPAGLNATAFPDSVVLRWDAAARAERYAVLRAREGGTEVGLGEVAQTRFVDTGILQGRSYDYRVRSLGAGGTRSPPTAPVGVDVPVAAPQNLRVLDVTLTEVELAWDDVAQAQGYRVSREEEGVGVTREVGVPVATWRDRNLESSTTYTYRVVTLVNRRASPEVAVTVTTDPAPVPSPEDFRATEVTASEVRLEWRTVPEADFYRLFRSRDGGTMSERGTTSAAAFRDTGLDAGTTYVYTLFSYLDDGRRSPPVTLEVTTASGG